MWPDSKEGGSPLPLRSERHGNGGSTIVLLHGFGTNRHTWNRLIPPLSQRHSVQVLEMKGFGDAPKPRDGRYSPLDQAGLVGRWILENDLHDLTVVGHSLGGGVALLTTLALHARAPRCIRRLVILSGIAYPQPISRYLRLLGRPLLGPFLLRLLPTKALIRTAIRRAYHPSHPVSEFHVEAYAGPLRAPEGRYALSRSAAQLMSLELASVTARYREITLPCLLLWGRNDSVVPVWVGERLAEALPRARLEILPQCGHMPQEEKAVETLARLTAFLKETD
ncbi:MAG: alpha/beta hydrolase [Gemmatimonadota bacterium]